MYSQPMNSYFAKDRENAFVSGDFNSNTGAYALLFSSWQPQAVINNGSTVLSPENGESMFGILMVND